MQHEAGQGAAERSAEGQPKDLQPVELCLLNEERKGRKGLGSR